MTATTARPNWLFALQSIGAALMVAVFIANLLVLLLGQWRYHPDQMFGRLMVSSLDLAFGTALLYNYLYNHQKQTLTSRLIASGALILFLAGLAFRYQWFGLQPPVLPQGYEIAKTLTQTLGLMFALSLWQLWRLWRARHAEMAEQPFVTVVLALLLATPLFGVGLFVTGDFNAHIARIAHLMMGGGAWRFDWYLGGPALGATGPLPFWLAAVLGHLGGGPDAGARLLLLVAHVGGALALLALLRRLGLGGVAALAGVLVYAGAAARWEVVFIRGQLPQALLLGLMPLLGWAALRALSDWRFWPLLPLLGGAMLLTHPLAGAVALMVVALPLLWQGRATHWSRWLIVAGLVALGAGAAALWLWQSHEQWAEWLVATAAPWPQLSLPPLGLLWVLPSWRGALSGAETLGALGLPACALMGWALWRRVPLAWVLLATLLLVLVLRVPFARLGVPVLFLAVLLVAVGMAQMRRPGPWLLALGVWMASTSLHPFSRPDLWPLQPALIKLAGEHRLVEVYVEDGQLSLPQTPGGGIAGRWGVGLLSGPHNAAATPAHNPLMGLFAAIEADWRADRRFDAESTLTLAGLDVGALYYLNRRRAPCLAGTQPYAEGRLCVLALTDPSPVRTSDHGGALRPDQAAPLARDAHGLMAWQGDAGLAALLRPSGQRPPQVVHSVMRADEWLLRLWVPEPMRVRVATSCAARVPGFAVGCDAAGLLVIAVPVGFVDLRLLPPQVSP